MKYIETDAENVRPIFKEEKVQYHKGQLLGKGWHFLIITIVSPDGKRRAKAVKRINESWDPKEVDRFKETVKSELKRRAGYE